MPRIWASAMERSHFCKGEVCPLITCVCRIRGGRICEELSFFVHHRFLAGRKKRRPPVRCIYILYPRIFECFSREISVFARFEPSRNPRAMNAFRRRFPLEPRSSGLHGCIMRERSSLRQALRARRGRMSPDERYQLYSRHPRKNAVQAFRRLREEAGKKDIQKLCLPAKGCKFRET